jgi:hypothetical protein
MCKMCAALFQLSSAFMVAWLATYDAPASLSTLEIKANYHLSFVTLKSRSETPISLVIIKLLSVFDLL